MSACARIGAGAPQQARAHDDARRDVDVVRQRLDLVEQRHGVVSRARVPERFSAWPEDTTASLEVGVLEPAGPQEGRPWPNVVPQTTDTAAESASALLIGARFLHRLLAPGSAARLSTISIETTAAAVRRRASERLRLERFAGEPE